MTHKQQCAATCMQHLKDRQLDGVYKECDFEHYYRKHKGSGANAFMFGLKAADFMIFNNNVNVLNFLNHESGTEK